MPKVTMQVQRELSHEDVTGMLLAYISEMPPIGVRLGSPQEKDGEEIVEGDVLVPKPELYGNSAIALDTYVLVVQTVPRAGAFLGAFLTRDGQKGYLFFQGHQFERKFTPA